MGNSLTKHEITRFVKTASTELLPNTQWPQMQASNNIALSAYGVPWIKAASTDSELTINDPSLSFEGDKYDAFQQSGDAVEGSGKQRAYAGKALYRIKIPEGKRISKVFIDLTSDKYCTMGVTVAAYLSDEIHESTDSHFLETGGYVLDGVEHPVTEVSGVEWDGGVWKNLVGWNTNDANSVYLHHRTDTAGVAASARRSGDYGGVYQGWLSINPRLHWLDMTDETARRFKYVYLCVQLFSYAVNHTGTAYFIEGSAILDSKNIWTEYMDEVDEGTADTNTYSVISVPKSGDSDSTFTETVTVPKTSNDQTYYNAVSSGSIMSCEHTHSVEPGYLMSNKIITNLSGSDNVNLGLGFGVGTSPSLLAFSCVKCVTPIRTLTDKKLTMTFYSGRLGPGVSLCGSQRFPAFRVIALSMDTPDQEIDYTNPTIYNGTSYRSLGVADFPEIDVEESSSSSNKKQYPRTVDLIFKKNNSSNFIGILCMPIYVQSSMQSYAFTVGTLSNTVGTIVSR